MMNLKGWLIYAALPLCGLGAMSAEAQPQEPFALCIAASCDAGGKCGVFENGDACTEAGFQVGTCVPCLVIGESSAGSEITSFYSPVLVNTYGFQWAQWSPGPTKGWDCYGSPCKTTANTVTLGETTFPVATCQCGKPGSDYVWLQVQNCADAPSSGSSLSWSTAPSPPGNEPSGHACTEK